MYSEYSNENSIGQIKPDDLDEPNPIKLNLNELVESKEPDELNKLIEHFESKEPDELNKLIEHFESIDLVKKYWLDAIKELSTRSIELFLSDAIQLK